MCLTAIKLSSDVSLILPRDHDKNVQVISFACRQVHIDGWETPSANKIYGNHVQSRACLMTKDIILLDKTYLLVGLQRFVQSECHSSGIGFNFIILL